MKRWLKRTRVEGGGGGGVVDKLAVVCVIMSMSKCMCACMHTCVHCACYMHAYCMCVRVYVRACVRECMFNTIISIYFNFLLDEEDITVKEPLRQMVHTYIMIHVHVFL